MGFSVLEADNGLDGIKLAKENSVGHRVGN